MPSKPFETLPVTRNKPSKLFETLPVTPKMPSRLLLRPVRAALAALALLGAAPARADDTPARAEDTPDAQLAAARAHAAAGRWAEAAAAAREIAFRHPHTDAGRGAAIAYLEGVDGVASRGPTPRPEAYDVLEADVPALVGLHCFQVDVVVHPEPCLPLRRYGAKEPAASGRIAVRLASRAAEQERWGDARARLGRAMPRIDRGGRLDDRILARALLGRAAAREQGAVAALAEYGAVRRAWRQPEEAMKRLTADGADVRRVAEVLEAVGEAAFFFAERARAEADALKRPAYRGPVAEAPLRRYAEDQLAPWLPRKRAAIERAEAAPSARSSAASRSPPDTPISTRPRAAASNGSRATRRRSTTRSRRCTRRPGGSPIGSTRVRPSATAR